MLTLVRVCVPYQKSLKPTKAATTVKPTSKRQLDLCVQLLVLYVPCAQLNMVMSNATLRNCVHLSLCIDQNEKKEELYPTPCVCRKYSTCAYMHKWFFGMFEHAHTQTHNMTQTNMISSFNCQMQCAMCNLNNPAMQFCVTIFPDISHIRSNECFIFHRCRVFRLILFNQPNAGRSCACIRRGSGNYTRGNA